MKRKNVFSPLLALAICFGCVPVIAHAAQQKGAPPPPQAGQPAPPHLDRDQRDAQRTISGPYRLTYTLTEVDGSKRVGSQHYQIVLDAGGSWAQLNLGTKIPIETGASGTSALPSQTQISYIDVGMTIGATLRQFANGMELSGRVTQSAVDAQQSLLKTPVIRQSSLNSTVLLQENKPVILGTVDIPGSTHSLQIQVELTRLR